MLKENFPLSMKVYGISDGIRWNLWEIIPNFYHTKKKIANNTQNLVVPEVPGTYSIWNNNRYLKQGIIHFSGKLGGGINPGINFDFYKINNEKYIHLKIIARPFIKNTKLQNVDLWCFQGRLKFLGVLRHTVIFVYILPGQIVNESFIIY